METARGLSLWLGAALLGSYGCALIPSMGAEAGGTANSLQTALGIGTLTLLFTVPGSALLSLAFYWTGQRGLIMAVRRALLIPVGAIAGSLILLPMGAPMAGAGYGAATAVAWAILHSALYGRS